ncbi:MAG: Uma2 family endonuclease [Bacteroidota bacterium]|nr:Uma2 family endonuclease [Bacteroidota bacterium]
MAAPPKTIISASEYLEEERKSLEKSEFYKGEMFAMAGATKVHNAIVAAILGELYGFLKGKSCRVFPSDLRVHNRENSLYTYPDVIVVCGEEKYLDDEFDTLLNPTVLVEVLSPATEDYDRGTKFKLYRTIPSLKNYILVSSTEYAAEIYTRKENNEWVLNTAKEKNSHIHISAINYDLALSDIYAQVSDLTP